MAYFDTALALRMTGTGKDRVQEKENEAREARAAAVVRDEELEREYEGSLTDGSSFAYGAMTMPSLVNRITGNVSAGNMAKAQELYMGLDRFVAQNADNIARASTIRAGNAFMNAMQQSSLMMMQRKFDSEPVATPDGSVTTLGELFGPDGLYRQKRTNELMRASVSREAIDALEGGDADMQATLRPFADAAAGSVPGAASGVAQRVRAGETPADPRQAALMMDHLARVAQEDAESVGWDALRTVTGYIGSRYMNDGTATTMYDTVMRQVKSRIDRGLDADPVQSAAVVTRAFDTAISRIAGTHSPEVNRFFAVSLADAVAADPDLDLDSPGVQAGLARLADTVVTADRAGVPMLAEVLRAGGQFGKAAAGFVQSVSQGLEPPDDNMVVRLERGNARLSACLTGGWQPVAPGPADPAKSRGRAEGVLKATSGSPGLDAATVAAYAKVRSDMNGRIARGEDDVSAFFGAVQSPGDGGAGMAKAIAGATLLPDVAARGVADTWRALVVSGGGRPVSLEDAMVEFSLHVEPGEPDDAYDARRQTRAWLYGNKGSATSVRLEAMLQKYVDPLLADDIHGISGPNAAQQWNRRRQSILAGALAVMREGLNPEDYIKEQSRVGYYYTIAGFYDTKDGKYVESLPKPKRDEKVDPKRYVPQIARVAGNLNDVEQPFAGITAPGFGTLPVVPAGSAFSDNVTLRGMFRRTQAVLKRLYDAQLKAAADNYGRAAKEEAEGGDGLG